MSEFQGKVALVTGGTSGIGLAHNGFLPMPEVQFLAYPHNAEDQIRGETHANRMLVPVVVRRDDTGFQPVL